MTGVFVAAFAGNVLGTRLRPFFALEVERMEALVVRARENGIEVSVGDEVGAALRITIRVAGPPAQITP